MQKHMKLMLCVGLLILGTILPTLAQDDVCTLAADAYRETGMAAYEASNFQDAIDNFTCVIELEPENPIAHNNLGLFYKLIGDYDIAFTYFAIAEELDPEYTQLFANRGNAYTEIGQSEAAIVDFEKAFALNPEGMTVFNFTNWGSSSYNQEDYENAVNQYSQALTLLPEHVNALTGRGFSYIALGEFTLALSDFRQVVAIAPENSFAYLGLGDTQYQLRWAQLALDAYQTYISQSETPVERATLRVTELQQILTQPEVECAADSSLDSFLGGGNQAFQSGDSETALQLYSCAIQESPDEAMAFNYRGFIHLQFGSFDFALSDLSQAIQLDPELALAYANRGQTLYSMGDYDGALIDLQTSIRLDTSATNRAYAVSGFVYTEIGDYERAIPYLVTAANSIIGNLDALSNLAFSYYQLERYDEAFLAFEQLAVSMNRDNFPPAIEELVVEVEELTGKTVVSSKIACGIVTTGGTSGVARDFKVKGNEALGAGNFGEAIEQFDCALEVNPFDSSAYNNRALAYTQMNEFELALENFGLSLELNPWDAQTYSNIGFLYVEVEDFQSAFQSFNAALTLDSDHLNARYGRADMLAQAGEYAAAKTDLDTLILLLGDNVPEVVTALLDEVESNLSD